MLNRLSRVYGALAAGLYAIFLPAALCAGPQIGTTYFIRGHLGSAGLLSNAAGKIVARTRFQPYGEPTTVGSETDANAYARFTGKRKDSATGLYYFGARYYDAGLGRFLSPDPAKQIFSPYAYAASAPLANVDDDGRVFTPYEKRLLRAWLKGDKTKIEGRSRLVKEFDILQARADKVGGTELEPIVTGLRDDILARMTDYQEKVQTKKKQLARYRGGDIGADLLARNKRLKSVAVKINAVPPGERVATYVNVPRWPGDDHHHMRADVAARWLDEKTRALREDIESAKIQQDYLSSAIERNKRKADHLWGLYKWIGEFEKDDWKAIQ